MPGNKKSYVTPVMVVAVCALALGPILTGFFGPEWRARWLLAWAANEYQNGAPLDAEQTLKRASELSSEIAADEDFWKLKFDFVFNKDKPSSDGLEKLLVESKALIGKLSKQAQVRSATLVGQLFHLKREHGRAVEVMETFYGAISDRDPVENNGIAYFRSLAKMKLDVALREIDAALVADGTSREEYLDTKAWILHGLNRDSEAILFAEEAIKRLRSEFKRYKIIPVADRAEFLLWLFPESETKVADAKTADSEISNSDSGSEKIDAKSPSGTNRLEELRDRFPHIHPFAIEEFAKKVASLRFHRACILDELNRSVESDLDYNWLDLFGFTDTTKIF